MITLISCDTFKDMKNVTVIHYPKPQNVYIAASQTPKSLRYAWGALLCSC